MPPLTSTINTTSPTKNGRRQSHCKECGQSWASHRRDLCFPRLPDFPLPGPPNATPSTSRQLRPRTSGAIYNEDQIFRTPSPSIHSSSSSHESSINANRSPEEDEFILDIEAITTPPPRLRQPRRPRRPLLQQLQQPPPQQPQLPQLQPPQPQQPQPQPQPQPPQPQQPRQPSQPPQQPTPLTPPSSSPSTSSLHKANPKLIIYSSQDISFADAARLEQSGQGRYCATIRTPIARSGGLDASGNGSGEREWTIVSEDPELIVQLVELFAATMKSESQSRTKAKATTFDALKLGVRIWLVLTLVVAFWSFSFGWTALLLAVSCGIPLMMWTLGNFMIKASPYAVRVGNWLLECLKLDSWNGWKWNG